MPFNGDPLAYYGNRIIKEHHATIRTTLRDTLGLSEDGPVLAQTGTSISDDDKILQLLPQEFRVGIIGAGAGGLYTALILDSLDIKYRIIEGSGRVGGRIWTHQFPGGGEYDYYERGAMRFPLPKKGDDGQFKNGIMKRVAELIEYGPLNTGPDPLKGRLIPYYFKSHGNPGFYYFNGVFQEIDGEKGDFNAGDMNVQTEYIQAGADTISADVVSPFARMIINDMEKWETKGWDILRKNDSYSIRGFMSSKYMPSDSLKLPPTHLPTDVINWCELLEKGSGGYDRSLTDGVFSSLEFAKSGNNDYGDVDWRCFRGGTKKFSEKMAEYVNRDGHSIHLNQRVTSIAQGKMVVSVRESVVRDKLPSGVERADPSEPVDVITEEHLETTEARIRVKIPCVVVTVAVNGNETKTHKYAHVVSTLPLPILRTIDLTNAGLNTLQKNALRALTYGPSIKIAVLFKSAWWYDKLGIQGGQTFTDLPVRTIVYPSYGADDQHPSKVIIASYCWTSDADRLGALAVMENRKILKELVLRNLAEVHGKKDSSITYDFLRDLCADNENDTDIDAVDWSREEFAMGAFGLYFPGQFGALYASLNYPAANKRLHFAGEGLSTRHAWVVGALDSGWKAVLEYLQVSGQTAKIPQFKALWGENVEWTPKPKSRQPPVDSDGDEVYQLPASDEPQVYEGDLLSDHLRLVDGAISAGIISYDQ